MSITTQNKVFEVSDFEYGYTVNNTQNPGGLKIELFIPKIMGDITSTGPDSNSADGIFDNDSSCKPSFLKKVNRKKSMVVSIEKNVMWMSSISSSGNVPVGTKFKVSFFNKNIDKPYASIN